MSVVHERQSRQLCAIHAVNNLLQLHSSPDADTADECCSASMFYQCGPFIVQRSCQVATKVEMDRIADDLALMERNLLLEDRLDSTKDGDCNNAAGGGEPPVDVVEGSSSDSTRDSQHKESELSLMDKLASNHRTIYLGCYSFESLELCLKRRGVTLEWYRVSDDPGKDNSAAALHKIVEADKVVCGFIINLPDESPTFWSTFRHVPVLGRLVHVGRHWFAVTRLRRRVNDLSEEEASASTGAEDGWLLIDSDREDVVALSDIELNEYLASIHVRGGQTFRAAINK